MEIAILRRNGIDLPYWLRKAATAIFLCLVLSLYLMGTSGSNKRTDNPLQTYLRIAEKQNPGLKAARQRWNAALERVVQARSLPDPHISLAYFIREVETRVGPQQYKLGLMQRFPWFGKRSLEGKIAKEGADGLKHRYDTLKLGLFYKISKRYYDYYLITRSIAILDVSISLLESVEKQVETAYSTGTASYGTILRIQLERDKLKDRQRSLRSKLTVLRTAINGSLNRASQKEICVPDRLDSIDRQPDVNTLAKILAHENPELKQHERLIGAAAARVKLSKKAYYPDISLGMDMIGTASTGNIDLVDNGKNPFAIKLSANIPIGRGKIRASIRESRLRLEAGKNRKVDKANQLRAELEMALFRFNEAGRIVRLYQVKLIPRATQAYEVTSSAFSTAAATFNDFIDTQRTLLEFELMVEKAKVTQYQSLALLEKIIGRRLGGEHPVSNVEEVK